MLIPKFSITWHWENGVPERLRIRVQNGLIVAAGIVRDAAKKLAPRHIGDHLQQTPVMRLGENSYIIHVFVPVKEAPDAGAWEYGSGMHRTRGNPATYSIDARNVPDLVFFWEKRGRWFVGPHVDHPGIVARPYLRPALLENIDRIRRELGVAI